MNTNILQKCINELKNESPKLEYVIGVLETLIDMSPDSPVKNAVFVKSTIDGGLTRVTSPLTENVDEEIIPDFVKTGPIGKITS
jgi:hypothetical protein